MATKKKVKIGTSPGNEEKSAMKTALASAARRRRVDIGRIDVERAASHRPPPESQESFSKRQLQRADLRQMDRERAASHGGPKKIVPSFGPLPKKKKRKR